MDANFLEEFHHLKIQLEEIHSATDNFSESNIIGRGGFGNVYKGVIPRKGQNVVAIKRLNPLYGQGNVEFWREITMLSRYTHENLIALVGLCDEGGEKILAYEHAYHGSLDRHLSSPDLKWIQRIQICLEAARGLCYLHDDHGTQQRVLHRDIKSSNILLDENWKAIVSDMGLSKIGSSMHTAMVTDVVGTIGYIDPLYLDTGILSRESDVYSFGVVLLEVLCGKLCYEKYINDGQFMSLVRRWKESYKQNKLADIIFQDLAQQIDPDCLETFSEIAFQCLQKSHGKRPTMSVVVEKLENALDMQENTAVGPEKERLEYYREIARSAEKSYPPIKQYLPKRELMSLLSKGVRLNGGKTRFWLDENGKHCEMVYIQERPSDDKTGDTDLEQCSIRTHVKAQYLSPLISYTVYLVCGHHSCMKDFWYEFKYRIEGKTGYMTENIAGRGHDGKIWVELYHPFISDGRTADLKIECEVRFPHQCDILLEGIEFSPPQSYDAPKLQTD